MFKTINRIPTKNYSKQIKFIKKRMKLIEEINFFNFINLAKINTISNIFYFFFLNNFLIFQHVSVQNL